jgi:hypothetical protein
LTHFWIFDTHIYQLEEEKISLTLITVGHFSLFWPQKIHFQEGRHENKETRLYYFGLRILLPIIIQLLEIENPNNPKIDFVCLPKYAEM